MFCSCRNIQVRFGRQTVLDVERLDIEAGQTTAVVGPNGAGKTTLLEVLALLKRPDAGTLTLWDRPGDHADRRSVVMTTHPGYMFRGSVGRNVRYGLRARGEGRTEARQQAQEALKLVGLGDFAKRNVAGLSAGERQRVNLARAIALAPRALLLDEPTANVDTQAVAIVASALSHLRDGGTTIVHVSPIDSVLADITERTVLLDGGRIVSAAEAETTPT